MTAGRGRGMRSQGGRGPVNDSHGDNPPECTGLQNNYDKRNRGRHKGKRGGARRGAGKRRNFKNAANQNNNDAYIDEDNTEYVNIDEETFIWDDIPRHRREFSFTGNSGSISFLMILLVHWMILLVHWSLQRCSFWMTLSRTFSQTVMQT